VRVPGRVVWRGRCGVELRELGARTNGAFSHPRAHRHLPSRRARASRSPMSGASLGRPRRPCADGKCSSSPFGKCGSASATELDLKRMRLLEPACPSLPSVAVRPRVAARSPMSGASWPGDAGGRGQTRNGHPIGPEGRFAAPGCRACMGSDCQRGSELPECIKILSRNARTQSKRKMAMSGRSPTFHNGAPAANDATSHAHGRRYRRLPSSPATTRRRSANPPQRTGVSQWKMAVSTHA
jgi:hypothetical protein